MRSRALRRLLAIVPVLAADRGGWDATCDASSGSCRSDGGEAGSCCPSGSWPALQPPEDYKPRGMDEFLEDLPVYVAGQPGPKAVVVLPEIFGFAGRLKGICDTLADEGYFVVMIDSFRGDSAAGKANPLEWIAKTPFDTVVGPDLKRVFSYLETQGASSVGALGFCWGAWAFCKASAAGLPFKAGAGAHPSIGLEAAAFGGDEAALARGVAMPVLLLPAGNDGPAVKPGGQVAALLAAAGGSSHEYPGMAHGWVTRGDLRDAAVKRDAEDAMRRILAHFKAHL
mmetsp:Transcript_64845/g.210187  ORF Transcript_64845/g.210187 Transcript_64845/m.210187 type:complete len:284 (-) Transcript_64845:119-970(-)